MKKAWQFLNGNKTIICFTAVTALEQAARVGWIDGNSSGVRFSIGICIALGGLSLGHHAKKGYFTTKK